MMEKITVTLKDGTTITYEGKDLSSHWATILRDPAATSGDYYKPRASTGTHKLFAYFGNVYTTLPL